MSGSHLSKDFFEFVKGIGESKSKQEEDTIVINEISVLKKRMSEKNIERSRMKEYLIRMIYIEMLGHDFNYGHIHAVNMTHERTLLEKRSGYLAVSLVMHPDHELMLLLINTLQLDLKSDNHLEVAMALIVSSKLLNSETLPALLPHVVKVLDHSQPNVRKKAIACLEKFYILDHTCLDHIIDKLKRIICDRDPAVMGASLPLLYLMAQNNPLNFKDLVPSLVSIIKQVTEHRLPRDFDYHRIPAPWIQIKLLQFMSCLGAADKSASEQMYEVLHEVLKRADIGTNIGYSIVYECVRTITSIYPSATLFEEATAAVSRFLTADNHNLKYLGINLLGLLVQTSPQSAAEHQLIVIDCLEDEDETLRRKTLELLFKMTNPANVTVIVDKLITYLRQTQDTFLRTELVSRITQLAERYAPSNSWYLQTMNVVFEIGGNLLRPEVAHNMARLIADGGDGASASNEDIRTQAVDSYLNLLEKLDAGGSETSKSKISENLVQLITWVFGEFPHWSSQDNLERISTELMDLLNESRLGASSYNISSGDGNEKGKESSLFCSRALALSALLKISAQLGAGGCIYLFLYFCSLLDSSVLNMITETIARFQNSPSTELQQRAYEYAELVKSPSLLEKVVPKDKFNADSEIDENLSFLDSYVEEALSNGAPAYVDQNARISSQHEHSIGSSLKFTPYQVGARPRSTSQTTAPSVIDTAVSLGLTSRNNEELLPPKPVVEAPTLAGLAALKLPGGKKVWGPDGYNDEVAAKKDIPVSPHTSNNPTSISSSNMSSQMQSQSSTSYQQQSQPTQPVAVKPKPNQPPTEKEKLAASLFAGLGATSTAVSVHNKQTSNIPPSHNQIKSVNAAPFQARPVAAEKKNDDFDFLDMAFSASTTVKPPAPKNDFDMMSGFDSKPANNLAPSASNDPLDFLMGTPSTVSVNSGFVATGLNGVSQSAQSKLKLFPDSARESEQNLSSNDNVSVSVQKIHMDSALMLAIFVSNKSSLPIVSGESFLLVNLPHNGQTGWNFINFECDPALPANLRSPPPKIALPSIDSKSTTTVFIQLAPVSSQTLLAAVKSPLSFGINLSYKDPINRSLQTLASNVSLSFADVLRPCPMNTANYGNAWKAHAQEVKFSLPASSCTSSAEFMARLKKAVHIHPVETIGNENIASTKLLIGGAHSQAAMPVLVLVHGKVKPSQNGSGIDIIVRSNDKDCSNQFAALVQASLK